MERTILGATELIDRIQNTTIRSGTKIADVAKKAVKIKEDLADQMSQISEEIWDKVTELTPQSAKNDSHHSGRTKRKNPVIIHDIVKLTSSKNQYQHYQS